MFDLDNTLFHRQAAFRGVAEQHEPRAQPDGQWPQCEPDAPDCRGVRGNGIDVRAAFQSTYW